MSLILYRRLDSDYEPAFGSGKAGFLSDIDAVAQAIGTRLRLFQGEWWEDQNDGLPLWQKILGRPTGHNQDAVNLLIQQRILGTPYVVGVSNVQSSYDASTRAFKFYCVVQTQFGQVTVSNYPTPPPQGV